MLRSDQNSFGTIPNHLMRSNHPEDNFVFQDPGHHHYPNYYNDLPQGMDQNHHGKYNYQYSEMDHYSQPLAQPLDTSFHYYNFPPAHLPPPSQMLNNTPHNSNTPNLHPPNTSFDTFQQLPAYSNPQYQNQQLNQQYYESPRNDSRHISTHSTPCTFGETFQNNSPWVAQTNSFDGLMDPIFVVKSEATLEDVHVCQWDRCVDTFITLEELIIHVVEYHIGSGRSTYDCLWRGCTRTSKPFPKRHKMLNHFRTHTGEKPFICHFLNCRKAFSRPDSLATHIKTHSEVRPFHCPVKDCGRSYYHSRSLRKHVLGHRIKPSQYSPAIRQILKDNAKISLTHSYDSDRT